MLGLVKGQSVILSVKKADRRRLYTQYHLLLSNMRDGLNAISALTMI